MRIDSTQLQTYIDCPRQYFNKFVLNLRKRDSDKQTVDLRFGGMVHLCNECYNKDRNNFQLSTIDTLWSGYTDLPIDVEKIKTRENGIKLCKDFIEHYKEEEKQYEILAVEKPLEFEIGKGVTYIVKVDRVVRVNGNIFSNEYKTTKNIKSGYFNKFTPNLQISAQTCAVAKEYGFCSGVLVDALAINWVTKPEIMLPDSPEVSNYSQVEVKYSKYYGKEMAYVSGLTTEFRREIINRTPEQLDDFLINARHWVRKLIASDITNIYPLNWNHCRRFDNGTNNKSCEFVDLCLSCNSQSIREELYEEYNSREYLNEKGDR